MKKIALSSAFLILSFTSCSSTNDSVVKAKEITQTQSSASAEESKFLIEMADARMMDFQEGKLAHERGTLKPIRAYGELMMHDQTELLSNLQILAKDAGVALPSTISETKTGALEGLRKKRGKDFDGKFISMISIDHERDVKEFKMASESDKISLPVKHFASQNLPLIQTHLDKIRAIKRLRH